MYNNDLFDDSEKEESVVFIYGVPLVTKTYALSPDELRADFTSAFFFCNPPRL